MRIGRRPAWSGSTKVEDLESLVPFRHVYIQEGQVTVGETKGVYMRETTEELVMKIELCRAAERGGRIAYDVEEWRAVYVFENHSETIETAEESNDILMTGDGPVDT